MSSGADYERALVMAVSDEESAAIACGDPERYFAVLDRDAVFLPPNASPKAGGDLRQWLREFLGQVRVEILNSAHGETVVAGDWAWHEYCCSWRVTPRAGGESGTARFKGLHVLSRDRDGSWKITRNIWNADAAG